MLLGGPAPLFDCPDAEGNPVSLTQLRGKTVVLYFYPRDNTPGCTKEACGFRDYWVELQQSGVVVLGVSTDSQTSHQKFRDKFNLPFVLLSDPEAQLAQAYGVWGEKQFMGKTFLGVKRTTFIIDPAGQVSHIFTKVNTNTHALDILNVLRAA
ncbi:thioredoxin-dependent thiol peroxidase [Candidatus Cyanaurora vandensis]|uniref:thioredoxin-dependent thiol peroxidase n=1 Tax=Candidatus Cyanaurora vandensis TaxID=2714958 RepID=UPI00257A6268|nr:thioredoxin-dependent thiol peroxidase [Candidatus Cyanaurora vandensis]